MRLQKWILFFALFVLILPTASAQFNEDGSCDPDRCTVIPPPQYVLDDFIAIVVVPRLNVRTAPSTETGLVARTVIIGERFPVVGHTQEQDWWLIRIGGGLGWVSYGGILVTNPDRAPDLDQPRFPTREELLSVRQQVEIAQGTVGVSDNLNMRRGPGLSNGIIGRIPAGGRAVLLGRNTFGTWFLVNYNGTTGWVYAPYVLLPTGFILDSLPVAIGG